MIVPTGIATTRDVSVGKKARWWAALRQIRRIHGLKWDEALGTDGFGTSVSHGRGRSLRHTPVSSVDAIAAEGGIGICAAA